MNISVQQMADRVAELMESRLGVNGTGLAEKLRRGQRFLPAKVVTAAQLLVQNEELSRNPRLMTQVDPAQTALAYDVCVRHLKPLGRGARQKAILWSLAGAVASIVLVVAVMAGAVLLWRGYL